MACTGCDNNIWKQKLGRCKQCMWLNFILLLTSAGFSYYMVQSDPKSVQTIAMLFALFISSVLMLLHAVAFIYYKVTKVGKRSLK